VMDTSLLSDVVVYSVQVACVVTIGGVLASIVRIDAADVRFFYWRSLLALCLALPWLQARQTITSVVPSAPALQVTSSSGGALAAADAAVMPSPSVDWVALVGWILVAGIVIRLAGIGIAFWRLRRLRTDGNLAPLCDVHDDVQQLVRARAEIRYVSSGQPVTFGFRRPVVLLPEILRSQSADIRRVVLCHELFHVRRHDWVWLVAEEIVRAVFWFHPAMLWLISRVRLAREEVVDELTVLATAERRTYMEALLVFADARSQAPAAAFARRRHLFKRMVLISKEAVMSSSQVVFSSAAMAVIVAVASWYAVSTFPLTQVVEAQGRAGGPGAVTATGEAGPLERQAKPITPENPVPRRTFSVLPQNPSDNATQVVVVPLRVVVDRQGRVGEVRSAVAAALGGFSAGRGADARDRVITQEFLAGVSLVPPAFEKAAADAVRQWQYEPPADGPIAFDVIFGFAPGAETRLLSHGGPPLLANGPMRFGGPPPPPPPPLPPPGAAFPPPPPPPPPALEGAVRVGGNLSVPTKVKHVSPVYPPIAQSARVQGVVIVEVIIDRDGHVGYSRVLRSIPLLDQAALDAVNQWEFTPTLLNGAPVPVIMTATVQFSLS
jgi:TonB family protein